MVVTSILSFSYNVLKRRLSQCCLKAGWCGRELTLTKCQNFGIDVIESFSGKISYCSNHDFCVQDKNIEGKCWIPAFLCLGIVRFGAYTCSFYCFLYVCLSVCPMGRSRGGDRGVRTPPGILAKMCLSDS